MRTSLLHTRRTLALGRLLAVVGLGVSLLTVPGTASAAPTAARPAAAATTSTASTVRPSSVSAKPGWTPFGTDYAVSQFSGPAYGFNGGLSQAYDGTHIWTANQAGNSLTEIDAATGAPIRVVSGPQYQFNHPWTIAFEGGYLWVTNPEGNTVTEVNPGDGSLVQVLSGGDYAFDKPRGIAVDVGHVWITNEFGNSVTEIHALDGKFMRLLTAPSYGFSHPNTATSDGTHVWVTNTTGNSVTEINVADASAARVISGAPYNFRTLAGIAAINGHVWVSSWDTLSPAETELNASDGSFIAYIPMPAARPVGIAEYDGYVWVALWEASELVQINQTSGTVVHTYGVADGGFQLPQSVISDGNHLWVLSALGPVGNPGLGGVLTQIGDPPDPARPTVMSELDEGASGTYAETVSALVDPHGLPTTYRAEWGTAPDRYDHIGPQLPAGSVLVEPGGTRVRMQLRGLPLLELVHWRIVATNGRGTHYGVDETTEYVHFFGVTPIVCEKHLQWSLITADIVGEGCWVGHAPQVPQNQKLVLQPPAPFAPGQICSVLVGPCPPPKTKPGTPPLYLSGGDMAKIPLASGPVMTAIPEVRGRPVTVRLNGTLITSAYVIADQPRGYVMANNASVDLAGSADGAVPPTPLARHATISAPVPSRYGPLYTGLPLFTRGTAAATSHPAAGSSGSAPTCNDPLVANAPLLGQFADPSSIGSSLSDLNLGGSGDQVSVHLINSRVVVCVNVNLPLAPCGASAASFGVKATLFADQSGLTLQDLNAHLDCAIIAGVVFQDIGFDFDGATKHWHAQGTVQAVPGIALTGEVEFLHGKFSRAAGSATAQYLNLGFLRLKEVAFEVLPDRTTGTVKFGSPFSVPFIKADPLAIDGGYEYNWGANPSFLDIHGNVAVLGAPVANGAVRIFGDGTVTGVAHFHAGIKGLFDAEANVHADFWSASPLRFNVDGDGTASLFDYIHIGGEVVVSDNGVGACVDGTDFKLGHFGLVVHANGSVSKWLPVEGNCDISSARDVRPAAVAVGLRRDASGRVRPASATSLTVPVAAGTSAVFFGVAGLGGVPSFTLTGPRGEHRDIAATGAVLDATGAVFHDTTNGITYVGIPHPSAGVWTVTAAPGSPAFTELRTGVLRPAASVRAHVVRVGSAYRLVYSGPKVAGQSVRFVERGAGDVATIGVVNGGGNGQLAFLPHAGSAGKRTIVAMVSQDGLPRTEIVAGAYTAPAPKAPAAVGRITATRRGSTLIATWKAVPGATGYAAIFRTSDGRSPVVFSRAPTARLRGLTAAESARITVTAFNGRLHSRGTSVVVAAQRLSLTRVTVAPRAVARSVTRIAVGLMTSSAATVVVSVISATSSVVVSRRVTVRAGRTSLVIALLRAGKRLPKGAYTVVVRATARGLPPQGAGIALRVT